MSDLQTSLVILGACVVAGVYVFNIWQERRFRRRAEEAFTHDHADVLLEERTGQPETFAERVEPILRSGVSAAPAAAPVAAKAPSVTAIDPVIDYVVEITFAAPRSSVDMHHELLKLVEGWNKPVLVAAYDAQCHEWRSAGAADDAAHAQWRFALQMSNRAGCIEPAQLAAFRDTLLKWSDEHQGEARYVDIATAHEIAVQLDRFCADVDIAFGINVVASHASPFSGTKIRALAEAAGLKLEADGVFCARNDRGELRFALNNFEPAPFAPEQMKSLLTSGVTFLLDVPRIDGALRSFDAMLETARSFSATLNGTLVDDNRAALSEEAIARIRKQLEGIVAKMEAGQLVAGGPRALRLFS